MVINLDLLLGILVPIILDVDTEDMIVQHMLYHCKLIQNYCESFETLLRAAIPVSSLSNKNQRGNGAMVMMKNNNQY